MDRCPRCWTRLTFIGVIAKQWARWLECSHCGLYVSATENGEIIYAGNSVPSIKAFREQ